MTPEMLEIKLRQYMSPGKPYYLKQVLIGIGLDLKIKPESLERRLRDVDAVYFRRIDKHKVYYIDRLPMDQCKWLRLHNRMVAFSQQKFFINIRRK